MKTKCLLPLKKWPRSFTVFFACLCIVAICFLVSSLCMTNGWTATVKDLQNAENSGVITRTPTDGDGPKEYTIKGKVTSGILIIPKNATKDNPAPAVTFTHGVYNNREMLEQFAIEMARRGFVTLMIDREQSGHNDDVTVNSGDILLEASKYLINLTDKNGNRIVDETRVGVAGHSFAGMVISGALGLDSPVATSNVKIVKTSMFGTTTETKTLVGASDEALSAGYHMGIISAALPIGCATTRYNPGPSIIALGDIKANSDDMYDGCTTKNPVYVPIAKNIMTATDFASAVNGKYSGSVDGNLYVKNGDSYAAVTSADNFKANKQYYKYTSTGVNSNYFMQSREAMTFVGLNPAEVTGDSYGIVNGGIYDKNTGTLLAQPKDEVQFVKSNTKYASVMSNGEKLATEGRSIRVYYEFKGIHQFCTFSTATAAASVDFFYSAYGVPYGARFISPGNQVWTLKEAAGALGIVAMFVMLIGLLDLLLKTKFFSSLKATDEEIAAGSTEPIYKDPLKAVCYWLTFAATALFGGLFYCYKLDECFTDSIFKMLLEREQGIIFNLELTRWTEVWRFAYWGMVCALFAVGVTLLFWLVRIIVNKIRYKDEFCSEHVDNPFVGFKVRSGKNAMKTVLLATIIVSAFYLIVWAMWYVSCVDFQIFTLNLRIFKGSRIISYLSYAPYFIVFYLVNGALGQNYRVKDMPEWLTVTLQVIANTFVFTVIIWAANNYYINVGVVQNNAVWKNFCYAYPTIPMVALCTVVQRRFYTRTGNAWLSAIVCGVLSAFIACANQCVGFGI